MLYLTYCQAKNSLLELFRHPGKLISYLLVIALIGFSVFTKQSSHLAKSILLVMIQEFLQSV